MKQKEFQVNIIFLLGFIVYEIMILSVFIVLAIVDINRILKCFLSVIISIYFLIKVNKLKSYYAEMRK